MKRVLIAVAGVGLVVTAIGVARAHTGETSTPDAQAPSVRVIGLPASAGWLPASAAPRWPCFENSSPTKFPIQALSTSSAGVPVASSAPLTDIRT